MAALDKIESDLNSKLPANERIQISNNRLAKNIGHKRRSWVTDDKFESNEKGSIDGVYRPENEKGSIDGVYRPENEKGSIDGVYRPENEKRSIDGVYRPENEKGSIDGVYRPENILLKNLRGNPLTIIFYLFKLIDAKTEKLTCKTTQTDIMKKLSLSRDSARSGVRFLIKNKFIDRVNFKSGKDGWSEYKLKSSLYEELKKASLNGSINLVYRPENEKGSIDGVYQKGSNSSSYYINTTTSIDGVSEFFKNEKKEEWKKIDITPLQRIGFEKSHLQQLLKLKSLSTEMIEDSIKAFAFDLEVNGKAEKINGSPLIYFIGTLRKGIPYLPPENYEAPETRIMRNYIEQKERQKAVQEELEKKKFELDLEDWIQTLSEEAIDQLIPEPSYRKEGSPFRKGALSLYFRENIWSKDSSEANGYTKQIPQNIQNQGKAQNDPE